MCYIVIYYKYICICQRSAMSEKIDLISKDVEFVKETVQNVDRRVLNLESSISRHTEILVERSVTDRQMYTELHRMNDILQKNTDSLTEHMRRTELNELAVNELKDLSKSFNHRLVPLEQSQIEKVGVAKLWKKIGIALGLITSVVSIVYTLLNIAKIVP